MKKISLSDAFKTHHEDQEKVITPEKTLENFEQRLKGVDLDIFEKTVRVDNGRLGIPVYFSMYGADARKLTGIRKQMGKGGTDVQARASAVMELAERFSFYAFLDDPAHFLFDSHKNLGADAMPLSQIALSVNDQSDECQAALEFFADFPQRWAWATDLAADKACLVPVDWFFAINEFNGTCAGNCTEEALCQGICEVVERHVSERVSTLNLDVPAISRTGIADPIAKDLLAKYDQAGILVYLSDFSLDTGIPTVGVLAFDPITLNRSSEMVWTAGTTASPEKALNRALTETAQLSGDFNSNRVYVASGLPKFKSLDQADFLLNPKKTVSISELPDLSDPNIKVEIDNLVSTLAKQGLHAYAIETTHEKLKIPAFYTIIPGTRFRERARNGSVGLFLAKLFTKYGPPEAALARLEQMEQKLPGQYYLAFYRGTQLMALDRPREAISALEQALERGPEEEDLVDVLVWLAIAQKECGQLKKALTLLEKACSLDDERTDTYNLMGYCLFALKEHQKAIDAFKKVLALDPGSAIDHANIASNYRDMGQTAEAIVWYEKALAIDPSIEFARNNLERLKAL
jgi:ribosomal protein S12 methylthiotransferase accessory factor